MTTSIATTTTPASPTAPTSVVSSIKHDWTWFQQHLLGLVFVALLIGGAVYGVEGIIARHDAANDSKWAAILATQVAQTKTLQAQFASFEQESAARDAQYQATISSRAQNISKRNVAAKQQATVDATLDAAGSAQKLAAQTQASAGEVAVSGNNVVLDLPITRRIVVALDALPVAQADLADTQSQLVAQTALTVDANHNLANSQAVVASFAQQSIDQTKSCNAQIKSIKAKNRRTNIKFFIAGVIVGIFGGHAAGF
jgi:hypothetical protein